MSDHELIEREKLAAARAAVALVEPGMTIGLGSGSTAAAAVRLLGERVATGMEVTAVPASRSTARLATSLGIPLVTTTVPLALDLVIDGADEFDPALQLIKGGGGDLLHEKIVASATARLVIMADHRKRVDALGSTFPLPVEVVRVAWPLVAKALRELGGRPALRRAGRDGDPSAPSTTDEGNYILDCDFGAIADPAALGRALNTLPGVVEHGLFLDLTAEVLYACGDDVEVLRRPSG